MPKCLYAAGHMRESSHKDFTVRVGSSGAFLPARHSCTWRMMWRSRAMAAPGVHCGPRAKLPHKTYSATCCGNWARVATFPLAWLTCVCPQVRGYGAANGAAVDWRMDQCHPGRAPCGLYAAGRMPPATSACGRRFAAVQSVVNTPSECARRARRPHITAAVW